MAGFDVQLSEVRGARGPWYTRWRSWPAETAPGPCHDPGMNPSSPAGRERLRAIARQAMSERGLLPDFSPAALAQAEALGEGVGETGPAIRDLRDLPWSSIDNDDSRDLDQVEAAEPRLRSGTPACWWGSPTWMPLGSARHPDRPLCGCPDHHGRLHRRPRSSRCCPSGSRTTSPPCSKSVDRLAVVNGGDHGRGGRRGDAGRGVPRPGPQSRAACLRIGRALAFWKLEAPPMRPPATVAKWPELERQLRLQDEASRAPSKSPTSPARRAQFRPRRTAQNEVSNGHVTGIAARRASRSRPRA